MRPASLSSGEGERKEREREREKKKKRERSKYEARHTLYIVDVLIASRSLLSFSAGVS